MNPYLLQKIIKSRDINAFSREVLGIPLHEGQEYWNRESTRLVNILKPANQWGKTTDEAIKHIFQAVCKPQMRFFNPDYKTWLKTRYPTLNAGKTYEIAKGVMEAIIDIAEGNYLLPSGQFNKSLLAGWAIVKIEDAPKLPRIVWWNNSQTLIRSYDGLGESFKRLRLAFISVDECGDIPELQLFLSGTLLPRVSFFRGTIDLVGTSQPKGLEYEELTETSLEEMRTNGEDANYFVLSALNNPDMAAVYTNKFMDKAHLQRLEQTADPELRKQIIYGLYVDYTDHLYTWDEIAQVFRQDIPWNQETGFSEEPLANEFYVFSVDIAATKDETSCTCIRYNIRRKKQDGTLMLYPHKVAYHRFWKGSTFPLSLQYEIIKQDFLKFKRVSPMRTKLLFDAGGLGGKNAEQAFLDVHGIPFPPKGRSYAEIKAEAMGKVKEVLSRNRKFRIDEKGRNVDINPNWGWIKASAKLTELRRQLEVASRDDDKLKNDQFTSFMQAVHFIEARTPKIVHTKAVSFNFARSSL